MDTLATITNLLLDPTSNPKILYDSTHQLHDIYAAHTGISAGNVTDKHILLPSGKAISSISAAHCLLEFKRTAVFIRGIYKAIRQLQQTFAGEKIQVLYAGCGPYATLLTPLTTVFDANEVSFHLLDINPVSLEAAQRLYTALGLQDYVSTYILQDATTYKVPGNTPMHLMVSETMLNALKNEPQVAIMQNLIPQLPEGGLFIPQNISITAKVICTRLEQAAMLGEQVQLQRPELGAVYNIGQNNYAPHEKTTFTVPKYPPDYNLLQLYTDITVYDTEILTGNDCSLNYPQKICSVELVKGKEISFTYQMGNMPGFTHSIH